MIRMAGSGTNTHTQHTHLCGNSPGNVKVRWRKSWRREEERGTGDVEMTLSDCKKRRKDKQEGRREPLLHDPDLHHAATIAELIHLIYVLL